jgi:hypothetical protein
VLCVLIEGGDFDILPVPKDGASYGGFGEEYVLKAFLPFTAIILSIFIVLADPGLLRPSFRHQDPVAVLQLGKGRGQQGLCPVRRPDVPGRATPCSRSTWRMTVERLSVR